MPSNGMVVVLLVILTWSSITCLIQAKPYERCELAKIFHKSFPTEQVNDCKFYYIRSKYLLELWVTTFFPD